MRPGAGGLLLALAAVLAACRDPAPARAADPPRPAASVDFGKTQFSPLSQIDRGTVARLGVAWEFDTGTTRGLEATPIVEGGVMYASGVAGRVYALEAASGRLIWKFEPQFDPQVVRNVCCDEVNRGVAVAGGRVYVAALDGRLYALDAASGAVAWSVDTIVDHRRGYSSTGAPQIAGGVVAIGNAGGDADVRGYVSAYDLKTGALRWRFFTVPGPPGRAYEHPELAAAARTWDPKSRWDLGGGGAVWDGMAYDPGLGLLYVGTGNPIAYPRRARSPSGGDNLYTCSILAIDARSGRLRWHYQEVPGDQWDYDADSPMILTSLRIGGAERPVLMQAAKDGFLYVLDRRSGRLLAAHPFVQVNWARGVDPESGRPIEDDAAADYQAGPRLVRPAPIGAHDWRPMAYDPRTGLVYLAATESGAVMVDDSRGLAYRPGLGNTGTQLVLTGLVPPGAQGVPVRMLPALKGARDLRMRTFLRAVDPITGRIAWQAEAPGGWWDRTGVLATAGGLVFQGTGTGLLRAFDAAGGRLLKQIDLQTGVMAAPMAYQVGQVQYLAVAAGWGGGGWSIPHPASAAYRYGNQGRILAFRLDGAPPRRLAPAPAPGPIPRPPAQTGSPADIRHGADLFEQDCADCHTNLDGSAAPDLRRMQPQAHAAFRGIVLGGALQGGGMPRWDDVLSPADADAIHAWLIAQAHQAFDAQPKPQASNSP